MRTLLLATVLTTALTGAFFSARAADDPLPRPAGAFATLEAADAAACMRLCADDGLCMAWTFRDAGACELRAVVPTAASEPGATSGVSARAPASMRRAIVTAPPAQPAPEAPGTEPPATYAHASDGLLGGPEGPGPALRPRHGGSR